MKKYLSLYTYIHFTIALFIAKDLICILTLVPSACRDAFQEQRSVHYSPVTLSGDISGNFIEVFYKCDDFSIHNNPLQTDFRSMIQLLSCSVY